MITWKIVDLTDAHFAELWQSLEKVGEKALNDSSRSPQTLWDAFVAPDSVHFDLFEDDKLIGLASIAGITKWSGTLHATFFDRRLRGREGRTREFIREVIEELEIQILHAYLPEDNRASIAWFERLGAKRGGVIKKLIKRNDELLDLIVFNIQKEDVDGIYQVRRTNATEPESVTGIVSAATGGTGHYRPLAAIKAWVRKLLKALSGAFANAEDGWYPTAEASVESKRGYDL